MNTLLAVFIGGGLGSLSRFGLSKFITSDFQVINPKATLLANLLSTLVLGVILFFTTERFSLSTNMQALIVIGFCGGFSTFSTFSYETFELIRMGNYAFAAINLFISILAGVGVLFLLARAMG